MVMSVLLAIPTFAQKANTDSIQAQMNKIEVTNQGMKQAIENYKKGVIKGDPESMNLLGMECLSGQYVKSDVEMGLLLLNDAATRNYTEAQYNLANYFYLAWYSKPESDVLFSQGTKWFKKAVRNGDNRSIVMLARFYSDYGKYKNEPSYINGGIQMLENYPKVSDVNNKDEQVLNAQAWLGNICLAKWRFDNDTTALLNAKKWYRILLKSDLHFPNYVPYIDSLQTVLSMGVPMRIDPQPTEQEIEKSKQQPAGRGGFPGGGMPGMGGGMPGMGGAPGAQGPQAQIGPQATFLGGNMQQFIRSNTYYPENLQAQKMTGRATVSFTVDTDGAVINPVITNQADIHIMNKEALRTVMIMPDWIPAQQDGKPVQAKHTANIAFGNGGFGGGFGF